MDGRGSAGGTTSFSIGSSDPLATTVGCEPGMKILVRPRASLKTCSARAPRDYDEEPRVKIDADPQRCDSERARGADFTAGTPPVGSVERQRRHLGNAPHIGTYGGPEGPGHRGRLYRNAGNSASCPSRSARRDGAGASKVRSRAAAQPTSRWACRVLGQAVVRAPRAGTRAATYSRHGGSFPKEDPALLDKTYSGAVGPAGNASRNIVVALPRF